jgi:hypothetical protein
LPDHLDTGAVISTGGPEYVSSDVQTLPNGWYRVSVTLTTVSGGSYQQLNYLYDGAASFVGDGVSGIYLWGSQIEKADSASSYIPTSNATITRNADVMFADISAIDLSTGYSVLFDGAINAVNGPFDRAFQLDDTNNANRQTMSYHSGNNQHRHGLYDNNISQGSKLITTSALQNNMKSTVRVAPDNFNVAYNGTAGTADTVVDYTEPSHIYFGSSSSVTTSKPASMHINKFILFDVFKTDAQLESLSTP